MTSKSEQTTINPRDVYDHIEDARLALAAAMDLLEPEGSCYSLSNWQVQILAALATLHNRIREVQALTQIGVICDE